MDDESARAVAIFLEACRAAGITVSGQGRRIALGCANGAVPPEIQQRAEALKPDLIAHFRRQAAEGQQKGGASGARAAEAPADRGPAEQAGPHHAGEKGAGDAAGTADRHPTDPDSCPYSMGPAGMMWQPPKRNARPVMLATFIAAIVADVVEDDGTADPSTSARSN